MHAHFPSGNGVLVSMERSPGWYTGMKAPALATSLYMLPRVYVLPPPLAVNRSQWMLGLPVLFGFLVRYTITRPCRSFLATGNWVLKVICAVGSLAPPAPFGTWMCADLVPLYAFIGSMAKLAPPPTLTVKAPLGG